VTLYKQVSLLVIQTRLPWLVQGVLLVKILAEVSHHDTPYSVYNIAYISESFTWLVPLEIVCDLTVRLLNLTYRFTARELSLLKGAEPSRNGSANLLALCGLLARDQALITRLIPNADWKAETSEAKVGIFQQNDKGEISPFEANIAYNSVAKNGECSTFIDQAW
jgi:hypothetical protein